MRSFFRQTIIYLALIRLLTACVDSEDIDLRQRVNVVVVDGTLTNLAEPQVIRLNRSRSDSLKGRFGTLPLSGATVEVVVDSSQVVALRETSAGRYQAPAAFIGQEGHRYQLRFRLRNGTRYESAPEIMRAVPPIAKVSTRFNATSLPATRFDGQVNLYRGANELLVDWRDPADQPNYYRWDWLLWEQQDWCRTCYKGFYYVQDLFDRNVTYEDCYSDEQIRGTYDEFVNDYRCRTPCWEIIRNYAINVFSDQLTNGGLNQGRLVAQIPYYQDRGCLVEIRQSSLTVQAYRYYKLAQEQSQNSGGVADAPPTALVGNVKNVADDRERVVGYFAASAVAPVRYWLDRQQNTGFNPGLFRGLTGLLPSPEGLPRDPNTDRFKPPGRNGATALCVESDTRTQTKPLGWRD